MAVCHTLKMNSVSSLVNGYFIVDNSSFNHKWTSITRRRVPETAAAAVTDITTSLRNACDDVIDVMDDRQLNNRFRSVENEASRGAIPVPQVAFSHSYADRWSGVFEPDHYYQTCYVTTHNIKSPASCTKPSDNVHASNVTTARSQYQSAQPASVRRRPMTAAPVTGTGNASNGVDRRLQSDRSTPETKSGANHRGLRACRSVGDFKHLLKRTNSASQQRRQLDVRTVRCACAAPIIIQSDIAADDAGYVGGNSSVHYVECRHARCFNLDNGVASAPSRRTAASEGHWKPKLRPHEPEVTVFGDTSRPATAPARIAPAVNNTDSTSSRTVRRRILSANFFNFVVGAKLHNRRQINDVTTNGAVEVPSFAPTTWPAAAAADDVCGDAILSPPLPLNQQSTLSSVEKATPTLQSNQHCEVATLQLKQHCEGPDSDKRSIQPEPKTRSAQAVDDETSPASTDDVISVSLSMTRRRSPRFDEKSQGAAPVENGENDDPENFLTDETRKLLQDYYDQPTATSRLMKDNIEHSKSAIKPATNSSHRTQSSAKEVVSRSPSPQQVSFPNEITVKRKSSPSGKHKHKSRRRFSSSSREPSKIGLTFTQESTSGNLQLEPVSDDRIADHVTSPSSATEATVGRPKKEKRTLEAKIRRQSTVNLEGDQQQQQPQSQKSPVHHRREGHSRLRILRNHRALLESFGEQRVPLKRRKSESDILTTFRRSIRRSRSAEEIAVSQSHQASRVTQDALHDDYLLSVGELLSADFDPFEDGDDNVFEFRVAVGELDRGKDLVEVTAAVPVGQPFPVSASAKELESKQDKKKLPRKLPGRLGSERPKKKDLWDHLQADFERSRGRKGDLKDLLASVTTNDTEFSDFRETLLKMESLRNSEDVTEHERKPDIVQRAKKEPWTLGRLALSRRACRFELPINVTVLEKLTPQDYMRDYCKIAVRRLALYKKVFSKHQDKGAIQFKDLFKALRDVFSNAIEEPDVTEVCRLLLVNEESRIDLGLFGTISAVAERLLYPKFVTEHTKDIKDYKLENIESADFHSIMWKLDGVNLSPAMRELLEAISGNQASVSRRPSH